MSDLVLFDLDGTLIDSSPGIFASMAHAFVRMGHAVPPPEVLRGYIGPPLRQSFPEVVGHDAERVERTVAFYRERYDAEGWREHAVYAGVPELVAALATAGQRLAIVTTKIAAQAQRIVEHLPFGARFLRVYGPDADGRHCEKAEMIATALADFGADPARTAMIGDRHFDMEGARANGVRALGVLWGFGDAEELRAAGAQALARTPAELLEHLLGASLAGDGERAAAVAPP